MNMGWSFRQEKWFALRRELQLIVSYWQNSQQKSRTF